MYTYITAKVYISTDLCRNRIIHSLYSLHTKVHPQTGMSIHILIHKAKHTHLKRSKNVSFRFYYGNVSFHLCAHITVCFLINTAYIFRPIREHTYKYILTYIHTSRIQVSLPTLLPLPPAATRPSHSVSRPTQVPSGLRGPESSARKQ